MEKTFNLKIITPAGVQYASKAYSFGINTLNGYITILAQHTPIITTFNISNINIIANDGTKHEYALGKGLLKFKNNELIVLTDFYIVNSKDKDPIELRKEAINHALLLNKTGFTYDTIDIKLQEEVSKLIND
jgi:F0F1-type ATP synthase epsilon subunit